MVRQLHAEIPLPGLAQHTSNLKNCPVNAQCYEGGLENVSPSRYDALVLSGSQYSAADDLPWIRQLAAWLAEAVRSGPPQLRIAGLCFGSQVWLDHGFRAICITASRYCSSAGILFGVSP